MDLQGRPEPEAFAGPAVERSVHRGDLVVAGEREVGALGEVLVRQAVGVLVGPPLPGVVGQREARAPRGPRRPRCIGELLTAVVDVQLKLRRRVCFATLIFRFRTAVGILC